MALSFCPHCGTKLPPAVSFCPQCGTRLTGEGTAPASGGQTAAPAPSTPTASAPPPASASDIADGRSNVQEEEGLGGLAKRWLKTQVNLSFDPMQGHRDAEEARRIEREVERRAEDARDKAIFDAVVPQGWKDTLARMEEQQQAHEAEQELRRRAEHEARPRAQVELRVTGAVTGELIQPLPVTVERPEEPGQPLMVQLEPLQPVALGGHPLFNMTLGVPHYAGQGTYDLTAYEARDEWDASLFQLTLDSEDESMYWSSSYGPGVVTVAPDERTITAQLAMEDSGSRHVDVWCTVTLP